MYYVYQFVCFLIIFYSTLTSSGLSPHALTWTLTEWLSRTSERVWIHNQKQRQLDQPQKTLCIAPWCLCHYLNTTSKLFVYRSFKRYQKSHCGHNNRWKMRQAIRSANRHRYHPPAEAKHKQRLTVSWITNLGSVSLTPARQYKPFILFKGSCKEKLKRH